MIEIVNLLERHYTILSETDNRIDNSYQIIIKAWAWYSGKCSHGNREN